MIRRAVLVAVCLMALTACRLDVTVVVDMEPDGTGVVAVEAIADAELVQQEPDLADELVLDDAVANGWTVEGPTEQDDGSLRVLLTHEFRTAEELANVLNSIGPPFSEMAAARTVVDEQTTNAINGLLVLPNGFESFADSDLIGAAGGLPFEEELAASGATPETSMSFTYRVGLPGELVAAPTGNEIEDGVIEWIAPLDGTSLDVLVQTVQRPAGEGGSWAGPVATVALVALIAWLALATAFIVFVVIARRRKAARRRTR